MYKAANEMSSSEMEEEQYDELFLVLEEPQGGYTISPPSVNHTPSTSSLQPVQSSSTRQSVVPAQPMGPANSALHHRRATKK